MRESVGNSRGWNRVNLTACLSKRRFHVGKVKRGDYLQHGKFAVVDQGQDLIGGYWDKSDDLYAGPLPVVVFGDHTRALKFVDFPFVCGADGTKVLVPNTSLIDPSFFYFALLTLDIPNRGYNRHFRLLREQELPFPPLPEQRTIARVLRTVQEANEKTEAVIAAAKELKKSLMKHLFTYGPVPVDQADQVKLKQTEIGPVPEDWEVLALEELTEFFQYGTSKRCSKEPRGWPVLRIPNVIGGRIDTSELKYTRPTEAEQQKLQLRAGDLLFVRTNGQRAYVGRSAVYASNPTEALFASYLIRCRTKRRMLKPPFLQYYTETDRGREWLSGRASGAADGKFNINTQILKSLATPRPPLALQEQTVAFLSVLEEKIETEENRVAALDQLFKTLLHDLMTAKLRVYDLIEEAG